VALAIPTASSPWWLGTSGKIAYEVAKPPGIDYDIVNITTGAKPKLLFNCAQDKVDWLSSDGLALCTEATGGSGTQGEQMFVLDLSHEPPTRRALFATGPTTTTGSLRLLGSAKEGAGQRLLIEHAVGSGNERSSESFLARSHLSTEPLLVIKGPAISPYDTYIQPRP
jgi:hypothetical protein